MEDKMNISYPHLLESLKSLAFERHIPIIREKSGELLLALCHIKRPRTILEIGSAIGYSALLMYGALPEGPDITTIERDSELAQMARRNFESAGVDHKIRLIEADAMEVLECLGGPYDMIFLDAAKGRYPEFLPHCVRLLPPGGLLVCDNVLYRGIEGEGAAIPHKMRTMVTRLKQFRDEMAADPSLFCTVVDIEDGLSIAIKL